MQTATEADTTTGPDTSERLWVSIDSLGAGSLIIIEASHDSMKLVVEDPGKQLVRVRSTRSTNIFNQLDVSRLQAFRLGCRPTERYTGGTSHYKSAPDDTEWGMIREGGRLLLEGVRQDGGYQACTFGYDIESIEVFPVPAVPPLPKPTPPKKASSEDSDD